MDKQQVLEALKKIKADSPKRNFKQSVDLIINMKGLDMKKSEHQVNTFIPLHFSHGREIKVCALVGPELKSGAKENCDLVVTVDEFDNYKQKKDLKKLAVSYDYFIAQATIMPKIATVFGRVFGPKGKMPNPKAGCVVPPNANLKPLVEKLRKTLRVRALDDPIVHCCVGKEDGKEEEIVDNIMTVYNSVVHALPNEANNIKNVFIKLSMGKALKVGAEEKEAEPQADKPKKAKEVKEETKENKGASKGKESVEKTNKEAKKEKKEEEKEAEIKEENKAEEKPAEEEKKE